MAQTFPPGVKNGNAGVSRREIAVFDPQAWESRLRRDTWQVYCCAFYFLTWELQCKELAYCFGLRLLRTFAGVLPCPLGKNSYAHHFKGKHSILYIVRRLNKCRFWKKKHKLPVFFNATKENCKNACKNDHAFFNQTNELIGYQNSQIYVKFGLNIP